jgi:hypothetical protein
MLSMKNRRKVLGIVILVALLFPGCGMLKVDSVWRDRPLTIDGIVENGEWDNAQYMIMDETVTLGLLNDDASLYMRLSTRDTALQRQILGGGLTVWFDENGKKDKDFGIRFPLPMQGTNRMMQRETRPAGMDTERREDNAGGDESEHERPKPETRMESMVGMLHTRMQLIGPGEDVRTTIPFDDSPQYGIECRLAMGNGNMIYELKFPLKRSDIASHGILTKDVKTISIGFEAGKIAMRSQGGGRGQGGGMGGGGGGNHVSKTVGVWLKATLAEEPSAR